MRVAWLMVLLLVPAGAADHVFSHRFIVEGRLIGGDGLPLAGRVVELNVTGERLSEPCVGGHDRVTDAWGDFRFCFHRHEVSPLGVVRVSSGNASSTRPLDADLRRMVFFLVDENATGVAPQGWETTYKVDGRVWERGLLILEGVRVSGVTYPTTKVNLTLLNVSDVTGRGAYYSLLTDSFGDFAANIQFSLPQHAPVAIMRLSVEGFEGRVEVPADTRFHRNAVDLVYPLEGAPVGAPPGSRSGPFSAALILAVALALSVSVAVVTRKGRKASATAG